MMFDFNVETIDHYTRNNDMELIKADPPILNDSHKNFNKTLYSLTTYEYIDDGKEEIHLDSLLNYIKAEGWKKKPKFVTTKQFLGKVASGTLKKAMIVSHLGVLFLLPGKATECTEKPSEPSKTSETSTAGSISETTSAVPDPYQLGANFHHFMTRKTVDQSMPKEKTSYKAVLKMAITLGEGSYDILYSGEIDAVETVAGTHNDVVDEHIEFKTSSGGLENHNFWINNSRSYFWQAYFANVNKIYVGARTDGKRDLKTGPPLNYNEYSLYKIENIQRDDLPKKFIEQMQKCKAKNQKSFVESFMKAKWNIETGKQNVHKFFQFIKDKCESGCYIVESSNDDFGSEWKFTLIDDNHQDKAAVYAFRATLQEKLGFDEAELMKKKK